MDVWDIVSLVAAFLVGAGVVAGLIISDMKLKRDLARIRTEHVERVRQINERYAARKKATDAQLEAIRTLRVTLASQRSRTMMKDAERIESLQRLRDNTCNEHERRAARRGIERIMSKYNVQT